jgi:hypothetical protein
LAANGWQKIKIPKFQAKSLKTVQFGQFSLAGPTGPVSSESWKNLAKSRTVVTLPKKELKPKQKVFKILGSKNKQ